MSWRSPQSTRYSNLLSPQFILLEHPPPKKILTLTLTCCFRLDVYADYARSLFYLYLCCLRYAARSVEENRRKYVLFIFHFFVNVGKKCTVLKGTCWNLFSPQFSSPPTTPFPPTSLFFNLTSVVFKPVYLLSFF